MATGVLPTVAGMVTLGIEIVEAAIVPSWLVPPGVEAVGIAFALFFFLDRDL